MEVPPPEDQALLAGIADRDPEAFQALMECYGRPVLNIAFRLLNSRPDAEEVAQEVFLRLYQQPPRMDPSSKLFTWIYRVTVNRCLDLLRRRRRMPPILSLDAPLEQEEPEGQTFAEKLPHPSTLTPQEQAVRSELAAATRRAISTLPEKLRVPLILSTFDELSQEAIGQTLGLTPKAVERRIARARELLKARLQPYL